VSWNIAIKRSIIQALPKTPTGKQALSPVRARVEHPFHIVKNLFRHKKLRDRGLAKLVIVKKALFAQTPA
jgi:transposase, IS5 family